MHLGGCTANPTGAWVAQQARNLTFSNVLTRTRFLVRERDSKYSSYLYLNAAWKPAAPIAPTTGQFTFVDLLRYAGAA